MSERKEFDLTKYVKDDKVFLDNLRIENCMIGSTQYKNIIFIGCSFVNVVFEGHPEDSGGTVIFVGCDVNQCVFRGDLGKTYLEIRENSFRECLFEKISMEWGGEISSIVENGVFDCEFKNVKLIRELEFLSQTIRGGNIENVRLLSTNMSGNQFSDLQINNTKITAFFTNNVMDSVIFRNVILEWAIDEAYDDGNIFYQCDSSGLTCYRQED